MRRMRKRLDDLMVERGLAADRDQALRAVLAREVKVDGVYAASPAMMVDGSATITAKAAKPFVSRGGTKLQAALDAFRQDVHGLRCIDIGSSTGGFTDCLLQAGAEEVTCVDVNYGQLAWEIRQNPRVRIFERTNIRTVDPVALGAPFDLIVADLSFIGLASLAPVFASLCHGEAPSHGKPSVFIGLIKPQFESRHHETDHGIVRDEQVRQRTVTEVSAALEAAGFAVSGIIQSPIHGARGNVEYLVRAEYRPPASSQDMETPA